MMTPRPDLNELAKRVHKLNEKWWTDLETGERIERNKGELLALVVSELSEALEGERKDLMDDHLPHRKMAEVEMADTVIRLMDYAGGFGTYLGYDWLSTTYLNPKNKADAILGLMKQVMDIHEREDDSLYCSLTIIDIDYYCNMHGYDLWGAVEEKIEYNQHRKDHSLEARREANGKKF